MGVLAGSPEAIVQIACLYRDVSAVNAAEMFPFGGFVRAKRFGTIEKIHLDKMTGICLGKAPGKKE